MRQLSNRGISALPAGHGVVLDIDRDAVTDDGAISVINDGFDRVANGMAHGVRLRISEILHGGDTVVIDVEQGDRTHRMELPREAIETGGNVINTAVAIDSVQRLMSGEDKSEITIHGPLSDFTHELLKERTGLPIDNPLSADERRVMPTRINVKDQKREGYLGIKPDFASRLDGDLRFLMREGVLMPTSNGDIVLSSCINSPVFWKQIENYLRANPQATSYFQPGSVHLSKLAEGAEYLPKNLLRAGRISVFLNLAEVHGFHEHLTGNRIDTASGAPANDSVILSDSGRAVGDIVSKIRIGAIVQMLKSIGLTEFTITNGPGEIIHYRVREGEKGTMHITAPKSRDIPAEILNKLGISSASEEVLSTGCGDTFTGAFIALSKMYPNADTNRLLEAASLFAVVHTHNPGSNLSNLNLTPLRECVIAILGQPEVMGLAA